MNLQAFGRLLIFVGILFVAFGVLFYFLWKVSWIGRLPGDIYIKRKNFVFYFPLGTGLLLSIVLSLIVSFFFRR